MIRRAQSVFVRILWLVYMTVLVGALFAQNGGNSAWEGAGAVGSVGEFPPAGLYAASDTFPRNSIVDVMNMDSGQSARLIVVRRVDAPGLFMLVSPEAAKNLGMSGTGTARLRVTPVMLPGLADLNPNRDLPYSPDPDINPVASLSDPNAAVRAARSETTGSAAAPPTRIEPTAEQVPTRPETPQQNLIAPGAAGAAQITGTMAPRTGGGVVPRVAAAPQAELAPVQPPASEPVRPVPSQLAQPSSASPVTTGTAAAGPAVPLPEAAPPQANGSQIASPSPPEIPQSIADASSSPLKPPAETLFGGVVAIPPTPGKPEGSAVAATAPASSSLYSQPDATNPASAEISRLETRTPKSSLFVPPRPEDTVTMLSPPPAPPQGLSISPDALAVATPADRGNPVAGTLPPLSAPSDQPLAAASSVPVAPGSPQLAQAAPLNPAAAAVETSPVASEIVPPQRYQEPSLSGDLPIAQAPGTETPSVADLRLQAATESGSPGTLPVAVAPGTERPEIADLGPVAPPKPQSLVAATVTPPLPREAVAAAQTPSTASTQAATISSVPLGAGPETPVGSPELPRNGSGTAAGVTAVPQEQPSIKDQLLAPQTGPTSPAEGQTSGGQIAGVPAEPRPPAAASTATAAAIPASVAGESWARSNLPLVNALQSNYYYLQIGAYTSPEGAKQALDRVASGYPLVVLPVREQGRIVYRLFVGPLRDDEKGAVLYWFKAKGYNDAFVRRGGES